jgi:hypothetical protein
LRYAPTPSPVITVFAVCGFDYRDCLRLPCLVQQTCYTMLAEYRSFTVWAVATWFAVIQIHDVALTFAGHFFYESA